MKLKSKDNKKKKAKKAAPYLRRTLEDERVHATSPTRPRR